MLPKLPIGQALAKSLRPRKQLERDIQHITEEMYLRNKELADTNQTLSLLRKIDGIVLESSAPMSVVCEQIAKVITQDADYPMLAIFTLPEVAYERLQLGGFSLKDGPAQQKIVQDRLPTITLPKLDWFASASLGKAIDVAEISSAKIAKLLGCKPSFVDATRQNLPIKSVYVVKLLARQQLVGVLVAGFMTTVETTNADRMRLLERLCEPVGIALDNRLLFEENRRVLSQLQRTNKRLKQLNDSKDDFIGMASHQLRTPLSSVKGYISLVMDGDAGPITETQHKLLQQSFSSAQKMVYLVADLLNVSRLKTGKFIIERTPTNLVKMIEDELVQLQAEASGRGLELTFQAPTDFPLVSLDETKTRQVVMNFLDNALYYTPTGGHVRAELRLLPKSIEFRVIDDGIGVPKAERHHLFTKFYRARNAQRARPDGTGLGLYMAQKVITAQGGAILFSSQENKGSTFGFTFPTDIGQTKAS